MSCELEAPQRQLSKQMTYMERVSRGIKADVHTECSLTQSVGKHLTCGGVLDQTSGHKVGEQVGRSADHADHVGMTGMPPHGPAPAATVGSVRGDTKMTVLRSGCIDLAESMHGRAPTWSLVARALATEQDSEPLLEILAAAPVDQQRPVLLMAALHDLMLSDAEEPLAAVIAQRRDKVSSAPSGQAWPLVLDLARRRASELRHMVTTRHTQTNEVGRCAVVMPVLAALNSECGPLSLVELGASAGLLLNIERYAYRYRRGDASRTVTPVELTSPPLELVCGLRGDVALPMRLPEIRSRIGIDPFPVDIDDPVATRWLEACVWPEQWDRLERLRAALQVARQHRVTVIRADGSTQAPLELGAASHHPVLLTSWALTYLDATRRAELLQRLDELAQRRDLSMVLFEDVSLIPEFPVPQRPDDRNRTVVALLRWRSGQRHVTRLGTAHPHGYWWHADR